MLVKIENEKMIKTLLTVFGLTYKDGKLSGELINFYNTIPDELDEKEHETYHKLLKAYRSADNSNAELAVYVGDLRNLEIDTLLLEGFYINNYNVLLIPELTASKYEIITNIKFNPYTCPEIENIMTQLIDNWPEIGLVEKCMSIHELIPTTPTPRFDYTYGATRYHMMLPIPFNNFGSGYLTGWVEVKIESDVEFYSNHRYAVKIANHHHIMTNILPVPESIADLIKDEQKPLVRFKKFVKRIHRIVTE